MEDYAAEKKEKQKQKTKTYCKAIKEKLQKRLRVRYVNMIYEKLESKHVRILNRYLLCNLVWSFGISVGTLAF